MGMNNLIEPGLDRIATYAVLERITELEDIAIPDRSDDDYEVWLQHHAWPDVAAEYAYLRSIDYDDQAEELEALRDLIDQLGDPDGNVTLIRDEVFEDYARGLGDAIRPPGASWMFDNIDWEAAADALKTRYNAVEWQGVVYWWQPPKQRTTP
jgi:hypothetical protein